MCHQRFEFGCEFEKIHYFHSFLIALIIFLYSGYERIAKILINSGADIDMRDDSECTPLFFAALLGIRNLLQLKLFEPIQYDRFP